MASELECSQVDRSPPIRSGYYYIVNRVNGNINLQLEDDNDPTEIPVVANLDSVAEIVSRFIDRWVTNSIPTVFLSLL